MCCRMNVEGKYNLKQQVMQFFKNILSLEAVTFCHMTIDDKLFSADQITISNVCTTSLLFQIFP